MIISENIGSLSPIILSVFLIAYLMIVELGNEKIRKALTPLVIVLICAFAVIFFQEILGK